MASFIGLPNELLTHIIDITIDSYFHDGLYGINPVYKIYEDCIRTLAATHPRLKDPLVSIIRKHRRTARSHLYELQASAEHQGFRHLPDNFWSSACARYGRRFTKLRFFLQTTAAELERLNVPMARFEVADARIDLRQLIPMWVPEGDGAIVRMWY